MTAIPPHELQFEEHQLSNIAIELAAIRPLTVLCATRRNAAKILSHLGINELD